VLLAEGRTIDHTTLSEFRRRHPAELKDLLVQICRIARELGLLSQSRWRSMGPSDYGGGPQPPPPGVRMVKTSPG